jgi:hypothetical protein
LTTSATWKHTSRGCFQQQQVHYPPSLIVQELEAFEYEYTRTGVRYSAPGGQHDDAVCALALAVQELTQGQPLAITGYPVEVSEPSIWSTFGSGDTRKPGLSDWNGLG